MIKFIECKECKCNLGYPESKEIGLCYECVVPKHIHKTQRAKYREKYYKKLYINYISKDEIERKCGVSK